MTRKSLQRLFPCDTSMVVIIDDRADVWDGSPNLVKVIPCSSPFSRIPGTHACTDEFFVGIGDINAAFLPKKQDLVLPTPGSAEVTPTASPDSSIISPSLSDASISNAKTLLEQIESRPLAHQAHSKAKGSASPSASSHASVDEIGGDIDVEVDDVEEEMAVLKNDDRELDRIFTVRPCPLSTLPVLTASDSQGRAHRFLCARLCQGSGRQGSSIPRSRCAN